MSEIEIKPLDPNDIPYLIRIDHSYHTDYVWQMDVKQNEKDFLISFKEVKLPRSMRVDYPRVVDNMSDEFQNRERTFVAHREGEPVGYVSVVMGQANSLGIISDIAVLRRFRRKGIGSALVLAVKSWLSQRGINQVQLEMQSKNHPAICMANKLGFEFCGYSDRYYPNQDIALFFGRKY